VVIWDQIFPPGFFSSQPVRMAIVVGGIAALVSGVVGVLTVIRGQSFAGHSLADVSTTGGSGAFLLGANPLFGFLVAAVMGSGAMEILGGQRARGRDVATGIVLGAALGTSALFLYWEATLNNIANAPQTILFGSIFTISESTVPIVIIFGLISLGVFIPLYRSLLLSAVSADVARAQGVPVRMFGALYLMAMALAVSMACLTVGAILSTALLIGPGAAALRLTRRPLAALVVSGGIGVAATWLGILLAYDSYYWPPARHGWPVSFFIVVLVFGTYLLAGAWAWSRDRGLGRRRAASTVSFVQS